MSCHADLNSEQKALLDFLVLAKGKYFVGFGSSTFSFYLREHRVLKVCCSAWCDHPALRLTLDARLYHVCSHVCAQ